jgi:hypothetical protein
MAARATGSERQPFLIFFIWCPSIIIACGTFTIVENRQDGTAKKHESMPF